MNTTIIKSRLARFRNAAIACAYAAFLVVPAVTPLTSGTAYASRSDDNDPKVFVCKYVGKPGVDETLKEGKNPISVSSNATVGTWFNDAQGRSYVLAVDNGQDDPSSSECPQPEGPKVIPIPEPSVTDPCGPRNAAWVVPEDTDALDWKLEDGKLSVKTNPGYVFDNQKTYHYFGHAKDSNEACVKEVEAKAPYVHKDYCGVKYDSYTIPEADGVKYYVNGQYKAAGTYSTEGMKSVEIKAVAKQGYKLVGQDCWVLHFTDKPCIIKVTPVAPEVEVVCGPDNDVITIPEVEGVHYKTYEKDGTTYVVAYPAKGYKFTYDAQTKWRFVDEATLCPVVPVDPTVAVVCGPNNDKVTYPDSEHVTYSQTGWVNGKNTVTATAEDGYYLDIEDEVATWTFTDENTSCGQVLGETTTTPPAAQLENTGAGLTLPMLMSTGVLGLAIMAFTQNGARKQSKLLNLMKRETARLRDAFAQPFVIATA